MTTTLEKIERLSRLRGRTLIIAGYDDGFHVFVDNMDADSDEGPAVRDELGQWSVERLGRLPLRDAVDACWAHYIEHFGKEPPA